MPAVAEPSILTPVAALVAPLPPTSRRPRLLLLALAALLGVAVLLGVGVGAVAIPVPAVLGILLSKLGLSTGFTFEPQQAGVLLAIRLPRVVLGALVGAALGLSGAAIQGLFRNPLADPGLLGISSGASMAAVATIVLEAKMVALLPALANTSSSLGTYLLPLVAFGGAALTALFVYRVSHVGGRVAVSTLLLVGVATNGLAGAFTGLFTYAATDAQLRSITFWGLGSLGGASWSTVGTLLPFLVLPLLWLPRLGKPLNLLALGEEQAGHLGLPVARLKWQLVTLATLAVGASVAMVGAIGFLGFLVPHLLRLVGGPDHRFVLPASALGGALVLVLADTLSRTIVAPAELPIGILTALLGAPVFLWMVLREQRRLR
jgi:iron complex transport system permease protein